MLKNVLFLLCSSLLIAHPSWSFPPRAIISQIPVDGSRDKQSPEEIAEANRKIENLFRDAIDPQKLTEAQKNKILDSYQHLDPKREVPSDLLREAVVYFDANKSRFPNQKYISVINYGVRSDLYRFFVINLQTGEVNKYHTSHGEGSDLNEDGLAEKFSNVPNSRTSSLGFARTGEVYYGSFKRSLRLDGLSSTNSKIRERAIVVHGWDEVHEANIIQGLSWGCPALDYSLKDSVIDKIRDGSLIYMGFSNH